MSGPEGSFEKVEPLPSGNVRLTVGIKSTYRIATATGEYVTISPLVSISEEVPSVNDTLLETLRLHQRVQPAFGYVLLREVEKAQGCHNNAAIMALARKLLGVPSADPPDVAHY